VKQRGREPSLELARRQTREDPLALDSGETIEQTIHGAAIGEAELDQHWLHTR